MAVNSTSLATATTDRGTKIVRSTNEMDKNAFLRILTAELSNQNPENATDSTQYVAQMAQFAALEQMTNLNSTMSFMGASALIGKTVGLNTVDETGNQYIGIVKGATKDGGEIILSVEIEKNNTKQLMEFSYKDVLDVY
ncbi:hypothetical protein M2651_08045 [Clostridium sp. SYSU_GA19001]|uniref:flagellar hook assembly protein FlgD n=1 Tax=Clostridium caldaquaticum TaxID=2940653 RepID=UPI0020775B95|nr:flagellar hook capping FlgD N-terminal domain-containing protein [Clostridium caldaquaticum]MCM8710975.1 hypothetical protein [Clostridium caldaquaticum]